MYIFLLQQAALFSLTHSLIHSSHTHTHTHTHTQWCNSSLIIKFHFGLFIIILFIISSVNH